MKKYIAIISVLIITIACQSTTPTPAPTSLPIEQIVALTFDAINAQTAQAQPTSTATPENTPTSQAPTQTATPAVSAPNTCIRPQEPQQAKVIDVVDGDTIHVQIDGSTYTIRYIGIDTPESTTQVEPYGKEASQKNAELVSGQDVTLYRDTSETDQFDRLLRFVFVGNTFINYELVKQGYAKSFRYPPDTSCADLFDQAQNEASTIGVGMWIAQATYEASSPTESLIITAVNKKDEYVDIKNVSTQPIDLNGWRLDSEKGSQSCTLSGNIQPGESLRIWAQSGPGFSCGFGKPIWNNSETDPAVLYNPQNIEIDRYQ